ncbi:polysaccharide biosynthesis protein [Pseudobacteroides cellulosolvens]|uniref:Polysaccharide biosynthesis protein CapD n=1 Tax=Pseudobacteroides cellulosolvens ATCC 35603 = DSM 2933 TaxID=398512 RepID=A0A0L6JI87_9FIRM|nr:nucleoside-diphosphate sugar epimerase/dehydratase [Pseudobacteroides cellulosolvens]KNY25566.1 polysaccharide biosynthesis protein CapD [Pseudobacteroides cellulosolvens ATCC 35603 = DSM 2933]
MKWNGKKVLFFIGDLIILNIGICAAFFIRFEGSIPAKYIDLFPKLLVIISLANVSCFYVCELYKKLWRYASIGELVQILLATVTGAFMSLLIELALDIYLPKSVLLIFWLITFVFVGALRISIRFKNDIKKYLFEDHYKKNTMIIGAGEAGSIIIKEMKSNINCKYKPVAAIDDDKKKHKTKINGVPIIGGRDKILWAVKKFGIEEIIVTMPSVQKKEMQIIINVCKNSRCKVKVLPEVFGLMGEGVSFKKLRGFNIEDLLSRNEICINTEEISHYIENEVVMVTGGGGSIGSELSRQIARFRPSKLLILDFYENSAFDINNELVKKHDKDLDIKIIIASIREKEKMEYIFDTYKPTVVFHAAAHKHVPLMEGNPDEAVKNNIFGTLNLLECADKYSCKKFVFISTDKAVNPACIMGATKRVSEILIRYMNKKSSTIFSAVRFGNVLGSNGSVVPLFKKQIEEGGPVTVTHPDTTRYFMTISEAASLVIQAGAMASGGEIFVLDMGKPVKILDLANIMISQAGMRPGEDIEIEFTGLRPGEKLHEELLMFKDGINITKNNNIFIEKQYDLDFAAIIEEINKARNNGLIGINEVKDFLKKIIPDYK